MRDLRTLTTLLLAGGALSLPSTALALPWDVDMVDSPARRGYSCWEQGKDEDGNFYCKRGMQPLPEGVVAQEHILSPSALKTPEIPKDDMAAWRALSNPLGSGPEVLKKGERMFGIYCTPCHGVPNADGKIEHLGTVAQPNRMPGVVALTGDDGVLKARNDGQVYRAIRVGNAIMPSYGWAMTDDEMWSIVSYARTLDQGAYVPPPPPPADDEEAEE